MKRRQWLKGAGAAAGAGLGSAGVLEAETKEAEYYELRTYDVRIGEQKVEMFTKLGELEIFRRAGLTPVFFGRTLIGRRLPNFVYMLTFADQAAKQKAWSTFVADPEWEKLKNTPGYSDPEILSKLTSLTLRPTSFSQV